MEGEKNEKAKQFLLLSLIPSENPDTGRSLGAGHADLHLDLIPGMAALLRSHPGMSALL